jgi:hypothetical protein
MFAWLALIPCGAILLLTLIYLRTSLSGELTFTTVDREVGRLSLPRLPWTSHQAERLIGTAGKIRIRGFLFSKKMLVSVKLDRGVRVNAILSPNGQAMIAGVLVRHFDPSRIRSSNPAENEEFRF